MCLLVDIVDSGKTLLRNQVRWRIGEDNPSWKTTTIKRVKSKERRENEEKSRKDDRWKSENQRLEQVPDWESDERNRTNQPVGMVGTQKLGTTNQRKVLLQQTHWETLVMDEEERQSRVREKSQCNESCWRWSSEQKEEERRRSWVHRLDEQNETQVGREETQEENIKDNEEVKTEK